MNASIIKLTPEVAGELLKKNKHNRKPSEKQVAFYVNQMNSGLWKENGEAIIIGDDNVIKDGQHRLLAVIKARHSYRVPLITEVDSNAMDTIDTGKNRSLQDIISLNGYAYPNQKSKLAKLILSSSHKRKRKGSVTKRVLFASGNSYISNSAGLDYVIENNNFLNKVIKMASQITSKSPNSVISVADLAFVAYMLVGYDLENEYITGFLKELCGAEYAGGSSASYVYKCMVKAKNSKTHLNKYWLKGLIIKAWNNYINGNPPVNRLIFNINGDLPAIELVKTTHPF